jgi:hypothetical protein
MTALLFLGGALLLVVLVRAWRPAVPLRAAGAYVALTAAFFALPLFGGRLQLGTDIPYLWRPWVEAAAPQARPANGLMWDIAVQFLPYGGLVRQRLLAGEAPLWEHEIGTGQPFLGISAPFSPLHLLALPLPPLRGLTVAAAWQMLLALLLMDALARALGAGSAGAALAAAGFALSAFAVVWLYNPQSMTAAWTPGVVLGLVALARREPRAFGGLCACALGMALSGHPETMALAALLAAAAVGTLLLRRPRPAWLPFLARLAGALALTGCLAAPALLPFVESIPRSVRAMIVARHPDEVQPPPFAPRQLAPLVSPLVFGTPVDHAWSGPGHSNFYEMCSGYAGLLTLVVACAGALALGGWRAALLAGGGAALLGALRVPFFAAAVRLLPGLNVAPIGRLRLLWVFAVALAAGLSLERLALRPRPRAITAALLAAAALVLPWLPPDPGTAAQRWAAGVALASLAVALGALLVPRWRRRFAVAAAAGAVAELFVFGVRLQPAIDPRFDLAPPAALGFLMGRQHSAPAPFRVLAEGRDLHANLGALYGLWDPRGYDPLRPAAAALVAGERLSPGRPLSDALELTPPYDQAGLDFLAVRYLLLDHRRALRAPWRPVFDGAGGKVWENPQALPLFFMPRRLLRVASARQALDFARGNTDFAQHAARPGDGGDGDSGLSGVGGGGAVAGGGAVGGELAQLGRVDVIRPRSNGFDLVLRSTTGGTVASSVSYAPGWRSTIEGVSRPAFAVNGGFLGFAAPPGAHRVRLDFEPWSWVWGCRLAAAGALVMLGLLARAWLPGGRQRGSGS